jgi:CheY-like chemotaxis protein
MTDSSRQATRYQMLERERKSSTRQVLLDGVLKALPTICVVAFAVWFAIRFGDVIGTRLLPNIEGFKAFGVELTFAKSNLQKVPAGKLDDDNDGKQNPNYAKDARKLMNDAAREQIIRRTSFLAPLLRNSHILWVDDHPENNISQRNFLQSIGISIDCAQDNRTAYLLLERQRLNDTPYDLVISDYDRDNEHGETGFTLLQEMRDRGYQQKVIYFTSSEEKKPANAFALTNRSKDLLNFIFDVLERENTAKN